MTQGGCADSWNGQYVRKFDYVHASRAAALHQTVAHSADNFDTAAFHAAVCHAVMRTKCLYS